MNSLFSTFRQSELPFSTFRQIMLQFSTLRILEVWQLWLLQNVWKKTIQSNLVLFDLFYFEIKKICSILNLNFWIYFHLFKREEEAFKAYEALNGRFYAGKQIFSYFTHVQNWQDAICGKSIALQFNLFIRLTFQISRFISTEQM